MIYILLIAVAALSVYVFLLQKRLRQQEEKYKELENHISGKEEMSRELKEMVCRELNTIYLYAALSEEETQTQSLKEKQKAVMGICENVMKQMEE